MDEVTERLCAVCGSPVPGDARFCPKCGAAMERRETPRPVEPVPAVAASPTAPPRSSKAWLIGVPIAIVILIGVIWALLAGMPFSMTRRQSQEVHPAARPSMGTIPEGTSTATTGSIGDVDGVESEQPAPTQTVAPPMISNAPPVTTATIAPPAASPPSSEITETEARAILARYLDARDPYHTPGNCLDVRGTGYGNRGFAFDVLDRCQSRRLGSWRVDSVTRELFEQKPDGRYLRP